MNTSPSKPWPRAVRGLFPLLAAAALGAALAAVLVLSWCRQAQFSQLGRIARLTAEADPAAGRVLLGAIRTAGGQARPDPFLRQYGYQPAGLAPGGRQVVLCAAAAALLAGGGLWTARAGFLRRRQAGAQRLAAYLGRVNRGEEGVLLDAGQDEFAPLRDELYKTVTALQTARRQAERAREGCAKNLANIAHQIKTPLAAACACLQLLEAGERTATPAASGECTGEGPGAYGPGGESPPGRGAAGGAEQAGGSAARAQGPAARALRQLARLDSLCSGLLTLSRIDAGVLPLERGPVDAYTALSLAADALQSLPGMQRLPVEVAQHGPAGFMGDLGWTVEALLNLMKNCAEHSGGTDAAARGRVFCDYAQNPLYLELTVWDEGPGFDAADLPHLFERFYRGRRAAGQGAGIGLALASEIVKAQNGVLTAQNRPEGGAQFSARFYRH